MSTVCVWRILSVHGMCMEVIQCPQCVWRFLSVHGVCVCVEVLPFTYMGPGKKQAWLLAGLLCFTFLKTEILKKGLLYPYL